MAVGALFLIALTAGQAGIVVALLLTLPVLRTGANAALAVGVSALVASGLADSLSALSDAPSSVRLIFISVLAESVAAAAIYLHVRWLERAPRRGETRRHAILASLYLLPALPGLMLTERLLDGLASNSPDRLAASLALGLALAAIIAIGLQAGYLAASLSTLFRSRARRAPNLRRWYLLLIGSLAVMWLVALVFRAGGLTGFIDDTRAPLAEYIFAAILTALIWTGLLSRQVLQTEQPPPRAVMATAPPKYRRSALTRERSDDIIRRAQAALAKDNLFADPTLTLPKLSRRLGLSPNDLSQALNQTLGQKFTEFVNDSRVAEAERLLGDPRRADLTVLDIAYEVGFVAKSTFNAAFVRKNGTTPSDYRKSRQAEAAAAPSDLACQR